MAHEKMKTVTGDRNITVQILDTQSTVWLEVEAENGQSTSIVALTPDEAMMLGRKLSSFGIHGLLNQRRALAML